MKTQFASVIFKARFGLRITHNGDGVYGKVWRLHEDGTVTRTRSRGDYAEMIAGETPPAILVSYADAYGIDIKPGREFARQGGGKRG
jgi:hypothetical protein